MHIPNLYKNQTIFLFRDCYEVEKIDGTSARIRWTDGTLFYSSGGAPAETYRAIFDHEKLTAAFRALGHPTVVVHGEAHGGPVVQAHLQGRYGTELRFAPWMVEIAGSRLSVPQGADVCDRLGLEHAAFSKITTDPGSIDAAREAPSVQSRRNGIQGAQPREGIILRPVVEVRLNNDSYVIAKHKRDEDGETRTPRPIVDPSQLHILSDAEEIAFEWVTPKRLEHVLQKIAGPITMRRMREVVLEMTEDVKREALGEIVWSKETERAIGTKTAELVGAMLQNGQP